MCKWSRGMGCVYLSHDWVFSWLLRQKLDAEKPGFQDLHDWLDFAMISLSGILIRLLLQHYQAWLSSGLTCELLEAWLGSGLTCKWAKHVSLSQRRWCQKIRLRFIPPKNGSKRNLSQLCVCGSSRQQQIRSLRLVPAAATVLLQLHQFAQPKIQRLNMLIPIVRVRFIQFKYEVNLSCLKRNRIPNQEIDRGSRCWKTWRIFKKNSIS